MNYLAAVEFAKKKCAEFIADGGCVGIGIGIVTRSQILLQKGYGLEDIETGKKMKPNTTILLASVSKLISGTLVYMLQKQHPCKDIIETKLNIPTSIKYVTKNMTVKDVMSHRGGIPTQYGTYNEAVGYTRKEIIDNLVDVRNQQFRNVEQYTNLPFTQGVQIAVETVGLTLNSAYRKLFRKLGMSNTSTNYEPGKYKGYIELPIDDRQKNKWYPAYNYNVEEQVSAGGIYSTVEDMNIFTQFHLNQLEAGSSSIIDNSFYKGVYVLPIGKKMGAGIHVTSIKFNDTRYIEYGYSGELENVRTRVIFSNDLDFGVFVSVNSTINAFPEALCDVLQKIVLGMTLEEADIEFQMVYQVFYDLIAPAICLPSFKTFGKHFRSTMCGGIFSNREFGDVRIYKSGEIKVGHLNSVELFKLTDKVYDFLLDVKFDIPYRGKLRIINSDTIKLSFWCTTAIYIKQH